MTVVSTCSLLMHSALSSVLLPFSFLLFLKKNILVDKHAVLDLFFLLY